MALINDDLAHLRFDERLEVLHLRQRGLCFLVTSHLFENIGK